MFCHKGKTASHFAAKVLICKLCVQDEGVPLKREEFLVVYKYVSLFCAQQNMLLLKIMQVYFDHGVETCNSTNVVG
jgi:hypothetical protein